MTDSCKGLFFRCEDTQYVSGTVYGQKMLMRLLKRKSCPGCEYCSFLWDDLRELNWPALIKPDVKSGAIYQLKVINISRDFETGYVDDYDVVFERIV